MNLLLWLVLGALAGWLAGVIVNGRGGGGSASGWIVNIIIGIVGAALGGFVASLLGLGGVSGFNLYSILIAVGGACLLLLIVNWFRRRK